MIKHIDFKNNFMIKLDLFANNNFKKDRYTNAFTYFFVNCTDSMR